MNGRAFSKDEEDRAVMRSARGLLAKGCDVILKQDRQGNITVFQMKPQKVELEKSKILT